MGLAATAITLGRVRVTMTTIVTPLVHVQCACNVIDKLFDDWNVLIWTICGAYDGFKFKFKCSNLLKSSFKLPATLHKEDHYSRK